MTSLQNVSTETTAFIASKSQQCLNSIDNASDENIEHVISTTKESLPGFSTSIEQYSSQISNVTNGGELYEKLIKKTKADLSIIVEGHV